MLRKKKNYPDNLQDKFQKRMLFAIGIAVFGIILFIAFALTLP